MRPDFGTIRGDKGWSCTVGSETKLLEFELVYSGDLKTKHVRFSNGLDFQLKWGLGNQMCSVYGWSKVAWSLNSSDSKWSKNKMAAILFSFQLDHIIQYLTQKK